MAQAASEIGKIKTMKQPSPQFWAYTSAAGLCVIVVDQLSKQWAQQSGNVHLNTGVSFGLSVPVQLRGSLLIVALLLALVVGRKLWLRIPVATGLFWGGAVSNALDRMLVGAVRDWMPVPAFAVTNNLADWAIAVGALWFVWCVLFDQKDRHAQ